METRGGLRKSGTQLSMHHLQCVAVADTVATLMSSLADGVWCECTHKKAVSKDRHMKFKSVFHTTVPQSIFIGLWYDHSVSVSQISLPFMVLHTLVSAEDLREFPD